MERAVILVLLAFVGAPALSADISPDSVAFPESERAKDIGLIRDIDSKSDETKDTIQPNLASEVELPPPSKPQFLPLSPLLHSVLYLDDNQKRQYCPPASAYTVNSPCTINSSYAVNSAWAIESPYAIDSPHARNSPYARNSPHAIDSPYAINSPHAVKSAYAINSPHAYNSPYAENSPYVRDTPYAINQRPSVTPVFNN